MPPRYSYWTIIADGLPTAFRAAQRDELLPTFARIKHKHPDAAMKWFARGKLWDSPESAQSAARPPQGSPTRSLPAKPPRGRDWRPGGEHRDPRQKYRDAKKARNVEQRQQKFQRRQRFESQGRTAFNRPNPDRPRPDRPHQDRSGQDRPSEARPREARPRENRPRENRPRQDRPRQDRPRGPRPGGDARGFEKKFFPRNQGGDEPPSKHPPRREGPSREPRPREGNEPTPPPRPSEPAIHPPGPPERGRPDAKSRRQRRP